ncbi:MAG: T9SS type A sorting domain-containing protein [Bacteroidales bacterium]|nr:T9SS type A sorting domain-containing protein [Bacteroidales bacterium]
MAIPLMAAMLLPRSAQALPTDRPFVQRIVDSSYYDAVKTAQGKLHFRIPVRFYYGVYTYSLINNGQVYYYSAGGQTPVPILELYHLGGHKFRVMSGTVVFTSASDGVNAAFNTDTIQMHNLTSDLEGVNSEEVRTNLYRQEYYIEFDWYPPEAVLGSTITAGIQFQSTVSETTFPNGSPVTTQTQYTKNFTLGTFSNLNSRDVQPQLINPIFYSNNENSANSAGKVAVPYVAFQQPIKYYTSWNTAQIPCQEQSGMLWLQAEDTVQPGFRIFMQVHSSESTDSSDIILWYTSNKVNVPAYHRIHDFTASTYSYQREGDNITYYDNRYKQLSWKIRYPNAEDIVPNDMFELQRAYSSDFSDAQTIAMMPIEWGDTASNEKTFTYVDSARAAWYNPVEHSNTIYYRVRRTSSAIWGWTGHDYARSASINPTLYLAVISDNMDDMEYRVDDNFAENHKVHLSIQVYNSNYEGPCGHDCHVPHAYWDDRATLYILKIMQETGDTIRIPVPGDSIKAALYRVIHNPDWNTYYTGRVGFTYTDVANSPCVHYSYAWMLDTTGISLPLYYYVPLKGTFSLASGSSTPYYTNAANLDSLSGTHQTSPEYVRLTWGMTDGGVDEFLVETRPDNDPNAAWTTLGTTTNSFWVDRTADPQISPVWQYRVTMSYTCEGNTVSTSHVTTGSRSPYGRIAGRVHYEDGSGCPGITVTATRTDNGATVQVVTTDSTGAYLFDSLPYGGGVEYAITPTSQTAQFRYNNTNSTSATITLTLSRCNTQGVNFDNISSVRFTGRVLFENSSVPVRDACFRLNGTTMRFAGSPVRTDANGNFELRVPQGSAFTLQVVKDGHHFDGDGYVRMDGDSLLTLDTPLDGVRVWDQTKVRLTGRVSGGLDQAALPLGLGLSHNNLGDNLRLVLELEGDNVSYVVRVPSDLTKDTLEYTVPHLLYGGVNGVDTVGQTQVHYQLRRVVIEPDPVTGEFSADLFPVRWKIVQANATGYATLFSRGRTGDVVDLSDAATASDTVREAPTGANAWGQYARYTTSNAQYKLTYRAPISITCKQLHWGMEVDYFGEPTMARQNITNQIIQVPLATKQADGTYSYLFGAPVFKSGTYDFRAYAHEDYYYNNDPNGALDEVRIKGGTLKVYNGMHENENANTQVMSLELDTLGSADFSIPIDYVSFVRSDTNVQRVLDLSVESEGEYVVQQAVRGYVTGHRATAADAITSTHGTIQLLDVLRDPPGSTSSAYIESGAEYSYSYTYDFQFKFGLDFGLTLGTHGNVIMGVVGVGGVGGIYTGWYTGQSMDFSTTYDFNLPITSSYYYKHEGNYTFRTNERISTSDNPYFVGQDADVYIGAVQNVYFRRVDAVQPLDSVTFTALGGSSANGTMQTVGTGVDTNGQRYYLVIGSELENGPALAATFAYTHSHIRDNLIPQLMHQRDALLLTCDSATAQATANARNTQVYWSRVAPGDTNWGGDYVKMLPENSSQYYVDEVGDLNRRIADWAKLLLQNEAEKVAAIHHNQHDSVATYSVSGPLTLSHTDTYSYSDAYHVYCDYPGFNVGTGNLIKSLANVFSLHVGQMIINAMNDLREENTDGHGKYSPYHFGAHSHGSAVEFSLTPIIDFQFGRDPEERLLHTREIGFTLAPDMYSNIDVSVYRLKKSISDFAFNTASADTRDFVSEGGDYDGDDYLYGSLVYYLRGGATRCPCEVADSTELYRPKMPLSAGTLKLENPKVDINVHELSNVPIDRPAIFTIQLYNELEATVGTAVDYPIRFKLKMNDESNPHGARVYIDGMPLTDGREILLTGSQVITKTMEVYAGDGYDFEDLIIELESPCIVNYKGQAQFSVHFMPVSCDVNIEQPHENWVLNTLSPKDSTGYYLPVSIIDYDVNYRGFDHIELQYKLSTQSADEWVTICSYYYDSAIYAAASGTKAMITGGRIDNIHFYGERDPIEQHYDLRAVSFCRHGSGFITKSSPVLTGTKDTRPPRVFGQPEPAFGILGVADNIKLRFNEPIAGNYLDEDNNFQLLGITNSSGRITTGTSLYFDGTPTCGASSEVTRVLANKSFSIDLIAKPYSPLPASKMELFGHSTSGSDISFGLLPDGDSCRMYLDINDYHLESKPMEPLTDFRRMVVVVDRDENQVRFFAGTSELTDQANLTDSLINSQLSSLRSQSAPLVFGHGYRGNMLETRVWIKALNQAEIVETHEKPLTGYEKKLAAYYPMNEGRGNTCADLASGSTLTLQGFAWTTPAGYALHLDGTQPVSLDQDIFSRSAIQDYTLMFWFRTEANNAPLFSAGWRQRGYQGVDGFDGTLIAIENGSLRFRNGNMMQQASGNLADGAWHHYVLTVNRTQNNAAIYVDGNLMNTFATDTLSGLSGDMMLGGAWNCDVLNGTIDELVLFEQALPKNLVETYDNIAPYGDEMGLVAWLPFSEQVENSNGIMEEHFSINNRKIFRTTDGTVVEKIQPLVTVPDFSTLNTQFATDEDIAPVRERGLLTKMNFDWSFNQDELLININMLDREINKNNIFITVRNVEDLNGNRTVSPTMWQVYVNKNVLLWSENRLQAVFYETMVDDFELTADIQNISGRRHQFTIEGLPSWMSVSQAYGSINPQETIGLRFTIDHNLPVGIYSEIIYLTDEDGLSEPLKIMVEIKAICPWDDDNPRGYARQMSLRGQVMVDGTYDSDPNDVVVALLGNDIVGRANVDFNAEAGTSYLYLTIHGNEAFEGMPVHFRLWQASTGRIYSLMPSTDVSYQNDATVGLPPAAPVLLSTSANEVQSLDIVQGWNWISFYLEPDSNASVGDLLYSSTPWSQGDQLKSVATQQFAEWDGEQWTGTFYSLDYRQMYLMRTADFHNNTQMAGRRLATDAERTIQLHHGWNAFPYLLNNTLNLTNAMADYIENVTVGDIIKSQTEFAVFSENERWEGSLKVLTPGKGYLLYRNAESTVNFTFRNGNKEAENGKQNAEPDFKSQLSTFNSPATNMTIIAALSPELSAQNSQLTAYINGTPVCSVTPQVVDGDTLFFLTLGTDNAGEITFVIEQDGTQTSVAPISALRSPISVSAVPNRHYGTLTDPVILSTSNSQLSTITAYPIPFTDHVDFTSTDGWADDFTITIYNASGVLIDRITSTRWTPTTTLAAGVYFATVNNNGTITTIKLIKK